MLSVAPGEAVVRVQLMAKVHVCTNTSGHAQWVNRQSCCAAGRPALRLRVSCYRWFPAHCDQYAVNVMALKILVLTAWHAVSARPRPRRWNPRFCGNTTRRRAGGRSARSSPAVSSSSARCGAVMGRLGHQSLIEVARNTSTKPLSSRAARRQRRSVTRRLCASAHRTRQHDCT